MKFASFMYWLPAILLGLLFFGTQVYLGGIKVLIFYLVIGSFFILVILWCRYWLKMEYK